MDPDAGCGPELEPAVTKHHDRKNEVREIMRAMGLTYRSALAVYQGRSGQRAATAEPVPPTLDQILRNSAEDWAARAMDDSFAAAGLGLDAPAAVKDANFATVILDPKSVDWDTQPSPEHVTLYEVAFEVDIALHGWADPADLPELATEHGLHEVEMDGSEASVHLAARTASVRLHVRLDDGAEHPADTVFVSAEWARKWGA